MVIVAGEEARTSMELMEADRTTQQPDSFQKNGHSNPLHIFRSDSFCGRVTDQYKEYVTRVTRLSKVHSAEHEEARNDCIEVLPKFEHFPFERVTMQGKAHLNTQSICRPGANPS